MALEDVLAAVPELRGGTAEPLQGGLTNENYVVRGPAGAYVVRLAGRDSSLLAIDRENEAHNTLAAAETGVGAQVVAVLPELGALVLRLLDGETLSPEALRRGDRLPAIAAACRRLHAGRAFLREFDMFQIQRGYLAVVQERGFRLPERYLELAPRMREVEDALRARPEPRVPCHNDLLAENILDVGGEIRLIDYEYSGTNEPSFELGNIWSESNLEPGQLGELVRAYYGEAAPARVARARLWGLASKYAWTLWGVIQEGISEIDFDFRGWAMEKYDRAVAELDGPELDGLLADARGGV